VPYSEFAGLLQEEGKQIWAEGEVPAYGNCQLESFGDALLRQVPAQDAHALGVLLQKGVSTHEPIRNHISTLAKPYDWLLGRRPELAATDRRISKKQIAYNDGSPYTESSPTSREKTAVFGTDTSNMSNYSTYIATEGLWGSQVHSLLAYNKHNKLFYLTSSFLFT
jgi:hypothetical protein